MNSAPLRQIAILLTIFACRLVSQIPDAQKLGAKGDGITDDTAALQLMLNSSHSVFIPDGTYLIACDAPTNRKWSSGGLIPQSGSKIVMGTHAVLKCTPNRTGYYVAIRLYNVKDVQITGGALDGNRAAVVAPKTEWGFGIGCFGCKDVTIQDVAARNFWGDGFYFGFNPETRQPSKNVRAARILAQGNRRNGASFISLIGFTCSHCQFESTAGTAPEAGVDIEPGGYGTVQDWECIDCTFYNNATYGLAVGGFSGPLIDDIRLTGGRAVHNGRSVVHGDNYGGAGIQISNHHGDRALLGVKISGMIIADNGPKANGLQIIDALDGTVDVHDNDIYDNGDETDDQVALITTTGVRFYRNKLRNSREARARYGLAENTTRKSFVHDNKWCNAGKKNISTYASTESDYLGNSECATVP
jgi:hypothetical protein